MMMEVSAVFVKNKNEWEEKGDLRRQCDDALAQHWLMLVSVLLQFVLNALEYLYS